MWGTSSIENPKPVEFIGGTRTRQLSGVTWFPMVL